jgi:hypothetical protein
VAGIAGAAMFFLAPAPEATGARVAFGARFTF